MITAEPIGWLAATFTLLAFSMRSMMALRIAALAANGCFIAYGALADLLPVLALHMLLLPCNFLRLIQLSRASGDGTQSVPSVGATAGQDLTRVVPGRGAFPLLLSGEWFAPVVGKVWR